MNADEHFDFDAWVDFARGLRSPAQWTAMQQHLTSCAACSEMAAFLGKLWEVGHAMEQDAVPQDWSRRAEQILGDQTLQPIRSLPASIAVLAFDSLSAAVPEHVRAASALGRHMIYHAVDCALYMKLDEGHDRNHVSIVGQITDRRRPEQAIPTTPIFLFTGDKVIASTSSNEFGEFQLACKPKRKLQISFPFEGSRVDVKLDDLLKEFRHS